MSEDGGGRLPYLLAKLKAPRVLERLGPTAERARAEGWAYERFLETLLEAEVFARDASGARTRIRSAGFPALKSLEDFDWAAQPSAERPLVEHLAQLSWITEAANVCFLGPPGTGKTHLAIALGVRACQAGHRVAFATAADWVARLEAAQERNSLEAELRRLERYGVLVVDEVGYLPLERQAANLLFALVARRYERGSIIVTSNRGFEQWGEILGDAMVAAALIDRLVHHATMVGLKGKSYRLRERGTGVVPAAQIPAGQWPPARAGAATPDLPDRRLLRCAGRRSAALPSACAAAWADPGPAGPPPGHACLLGERRGPAELVHFSLADPGALFGGR